MSRINPRLVYWIAALHDDAQLKAAHRDILTYLAVKRLDFGTGSGYCSVESLAKGADWSEATVKRALDIAQKTEPPLLKRTRRGHHRGDGQNLASEWQLLYPASTAHGCDVEKGEQLTGATLTDLNSSEAKSQQRTSEPPTGLESSTGDDDARAAAAAAVAAKYAWPLDHAKRVVAAAIAKSRDPVNDPEKYVLAALRRSPASWAPDAPRWHHVERGARGGKVAAQRPPWCRRCNEQTRHVEDPENGADRGRCPACHPLAVRTSP